MPDFFRLISEYFWLIALGFAAFNYGKAERETAKTAKSEKAVEASTYVRNFSIVAALPWLVMGAGQMTGSTPTVWYYFRPQDGNVFVIGWLAVVFAISCLFAWWVFVAGGAKKVVEFNLLAAIGQHGTKPPSENMVKFFAALGVLIFPIWVLLAVSMDAPLPG